MTDLIPIGPEELARQARELAAGSHAANTRRAYEADWRDFRGWCEQRGVSPCPAGEDTVVLYLTDLARSRKASTLTRRLAALAQAHRAAGWEAPGEMAGVRRLMRGIRRRLGTAPEAKRPVLIGDLKAMVKALPDTAAGLRDRALLLVGFAAALRRSELVGLDVEDLEENGDGLVVRIRRGKTDQEGEGRKVGIPRGREEKSCPVRAVAAWRERGGIETGPLFRPVSRHGRIAKTRLSADAVARIVKRQARALGREERLFAGHSLRAGLATSAAMAGKPERAIMNQTGHRSVAAVRRYIRDGELFRENAAEGLGL